MKYANLQQLYSSQFYFNNQLVNNITDRENRPLAVRDEEWVGIYIYIFIYEYIYDSLHRSAVTNFNVLKIIAILGVEFC